MSPVFSHSVDATADDQSLGRLMNDSYYFPNAIMKRISVDKKHHLCLFALRNIGAGEEILYSYGEKGFAWHEMVILFSDVLIL